MRRLHSLVAGVVLTISLVASGVVLAAEPQTSSDAPRYKLRPGQQLNYAGESTFDYERGKLHDKSTWQVTVVRGNDDGGWRLLLRSGLSYAQVRSGKNGEPAAGEPTYSPERVTLAWCDLMPDGGMAQNSTLGFSVNPRSVLPLLPPEREASEWSIRDDKTAIEHDYSRAAADADDVKHVVIADTSKTPEDEIYLATHSNKFWFDPERGLVDRIENTSTQGFGFNGKGVGTTKLEGVEEHDAAWCDILASDMERFFAAKREYDDLVERAGKEFDHTDTLLDEAKSRLNEIHKSLKSQMFAEEITALLKKHDQMVSYARDEAKRLGEVVGKPAAEWETTDLDGAPKSMAACRGKVVILDFWYRGCGWCIRAMPQVKEVAAHYQGRPVEVFGMNTDSKEEDARFVIEKLGLQYPTLKAEGLPEKFGVQGFPTLVIIDQEGVVRDVHVGYSPSLAQNVIASVDKLLTNPPAK